MRLWHLVVFSQVATAQISSNYDRYAASSSLLYQKRPAWPGIKGGSCQLTAQNGRLQHRSSKSLCGNVGCIDLVSENHRNYIKIKSLLQWSRNDSFVITACLQACLPQLKLKTPLRKSDESARRFPLDLSGWSNDAVYPKTDSLSYFHFSKAVWANSGFESSHLQFGHGYLECLCLGRKQNYW